VEVGSSDTHLFIHVGPSQAYAIPKTAFADQEQLKQFEAAYQAHQQEPQ
jgi:hypothetical protein